jgi:hypothetical protein
MLLRKIPGVLTVQMETSFRSAFFHFFNIKLTCFCPMYFQMAIGIRKKRTIATKMAREIPRAYGYAGEWANVNIINEEWDYLEGMASGGFISEMESRKDDLKYGDGNDKYCQDSNYGPDALKHRFVVSGGSPGDFSETAGPNIGGNLAKL